MEQLKEEEKKKEKGFIKKMFGKKQERNPKASQEEGFALTKDNANQMIISSEILNLFVEQDDTSQENKDSPNDDSQEEKEKNNNSGCPADGESFGFGRTELMRSREVEPSPKEISDLIFKRFVEPSRFKNLTSEKIDYYQKIYGRLLRHKRLIAKHVALGLEHKIPQDTYSNPPSKEGNPIAFYFDYSGSNVPSISMYVGIIGRLIKRNVCIYIGSNDTIETRYRLKTENPTIDLGMIINDRYGYQTQKMRSQIEKEYEIIHYSGETVDEVVKKDFVQTIALFTDFDGGEVMMKTAEICKAYWFCTQHRNSGNAPYSITDKNGEHVTYSEDLMGMSVIDFKGHFIILDKPIDIVNYLKDNFNDTSYEEKQKCKQTGISQKTLVLRNKNTFPK